MKASKKKILVLSDLKGYNNAILKNAMNLADRLGADIDLFHVKKPTEVVESANQLSAMRSINSMHIKTERQIKKQLDSIENIGNVNFKPSFAFGNVKEEISRQIKKSSPDLIVLGKRKAHPLKFVGDGIIDFILKTYSGPIFIASDKNIIEANKDVALGVLNGKDLSNSDVAEQLLSGSKQPLKSFKIQDSKSQQTETSSKVKTEFVFEKNDDALRNLSNYLEKSKINLLCIDRNEPISGEPRKKVINEVKDVISKVNVSMLLSNVS